jgi:autotransporter strand-loop-strand O-heptosyltransferase
MDRNNDELVIILAHPNNNYRKKLLIECLQNTNKEILLSTNYFVDESVEKFCDHVIYTKKNPILYKEDFHKYDVAYYSWKIGDDGIRHTKMFDYEHGYAVYTLIQNGLRYADSMGKKVVHVINYDYLIQDQIINENYLELKNTDIILYKHMTTNYGEESVSSGIISGKINKLNDFFQKYKTIDEYYHGGNSDGFAILEGKLHRHYLKANDIKIKYKVYEELKNGNILDREGTSLFSNDNDNEINDFSTVANTLYDNINQNKNIVNAKNSIKIKNYFIDGGYIEVNSPFKKKFTVEFWNNKNECEFTSIIESNCWAKTNKKYFEEYTCKVYDSDVLVYDETYNANGKRVYITLDSKSLGDTLAWFPYVDEFRKKWNCEMICSTFWNDLFEKQYPNIKFVSPGSIVNDLYAMYSIGWYYSDDTIDYTRNPQDFKKISLQQTATDILGLEFSHIKAKLDLPTVEKKKKVGLGIHSTAQAKYWNNPTGWQEVTDYLTQRNYEVIILSKEEDGYMGNKYPIGANKFPSGSINNLIQEMLSCDFFIGIGSGLSWLAWTLDLPIILISGFSTPISEFSGDNVYRIINESVCNGCFNRYRLDAGDWNWCPDNKNTEKQFECTKSISFEDVEPYLKKIIKNNMD